MKKVLLILFLLTLNIIVTAQSSEIDKLKKELKNHAKQDTFRVNRLNHLATFSYLRLSDTKKYAEEALAISQKINYERGEGFARAILGNIKQLQGYTSEGERLLLLADSIANKTGDKELKANVLVRSSNGKADHLKDSLFKEAYTLARVFDDQRLKIVIISNLAYLSKDPKEQKTLYKQADSVAQKSGSLILQANVVWNQAVHTEQLEEKERLYLKSFSMIEKSGDLYYLVYRLNTYGYYLAASGKKDALKYYLKAYNTAKKLDDQIIISSAEARIGDYYSFYLTDYAKGMEYYLKSLHSAEEVNDTESLIDSWISLGALYAALGDQENSLTYLLKAKEANKELGDKIIEYRLQGNIGERYRLIGKYPEAITAYTTSKKIYNDMNAGYIDHIAESNLADVYTRMDSLVQAFHHGFISFKATKEYEDIATEGWVDGILSRAYLKKHMADSAIFYGELGLAAAKQTGTIEFMRDNTLALANAYAAKKDYPKAYTNHLLYVNYRDSMLNSEVRNRTAVQHYTFNLDKKEAEISVLHEQRKGQRNLLIGAVVLLGLILAIAALLLRNNRLKQKANRLLETQKQEINEKAQELAKQKNNVELLSKIGRKITSSLSVEKIIGTAYENINKLMDANVFGIGIYNADLKRLEFPATFENGEKLPFYWNAIEDKTRFGSVCFNRGEEIAIGNLDEEYKDHIQEVPTPHEGGQPVSIIFLPLMSKEEKLGVITVQSFQKNAYSDYQLYMFRNIATYTAIAIENAESYETLNHTLSSLKATQTQLIHSEKMASLGELTAGIAHEIQNPLNFVNNFSEVSNELIDEMNEELAKGDFEEAKAIAADVKQNLEKINHHGKRAGDIVKSMLQHSRTSTGTKEPTDINALADEYLRLSYHGLRAKDKSFNADFKSEFDKNVAKINVIPQDIGRVLLNILNNAFFAVKEKNKMNIEGYNPTVSIFTKKVADTVEIIINDNGDGIPPEVLDKIFQPFFTTKPTGDGTGLGLSLSYDIIKAHGGELIVTTKEKEFTEFKIVLPND